MKVLPGQVAVITGGASGIGLALATQLAGLGLRIALADIEPDALDTAVARLRASGARVIGVVTNVSRSSALETLRERVIDAFGRVDIIVNNAGVVSAYGPLWETTEQDWRWLTGVNYWGVIHGIRAFVPLLVAQRSGHVVNTASMAGVTVLAYNGIYNATKHAVVSITETLRAEFEDQGLAIGATVLCPGIVPTRIREAARNRPGGATAREATTANYLPKPPIPDTPVTIDAADVAGQIVAAIESGQTYLAPNPGSGPMVAHRAACLLADMGDR